MWSVPGCREGHQGERVWCLKFLCWKCCLSDARTNPARIEIASDRLQPTGQEQVRVLETGVDLSAKSGVGPEFRQCGPESGCVPVHLIHGRGFPEKGAQYPSENDRTIPGA